ncbi:synaptonemal complex protein 2 [Engraulis encrasicolus]|uniref:synaptonemal complex protein 2 n=1 Tax=Engraulis encrasicolus TaxID=184585 RepID=UPI002FD59994
MAPRQDQQIEKLLDEALKQKRFQGLEEFLEDKNNEGSPSKCSKQFLTKLDKFISRELDLKNVENACLGFKLLHTFGSNLVFPGGEGLAGMVSQGIVDKMEHWFDKAWLLWEEGGDEESDVLLRLTEDFFDALMAIHDSGKEGTEQVNESFLTLTGKLASNSQVHISVQKEAVQKLNALLCAMPSELRKERKSLSKEDSDVIKELAGRILTCGDYDLQAATLEAICRMSSVAQRRDFVYNWFTMDYVASAFLKIREAQFETDCRKFLNMVNGMKGDIARVYSYPCLGVFLDQHELLIPSDELEEFWIDFNIGSLSLSFYCMLTNHDDHEPISTWETFFLPGHAVKNYFVDEHEDKKVLSIQLAAPYFLGQISGTRLSIHFSSTLNVLQAAQKVFGGGKNKRFVGKSGTSVVKTTVQIILDENSQAFSQVLIPDSQISLSQRSEREPPALNSATTHVPLPSSVPAENNNNNLPASLNKQGVTPARPKISKTSTFIVSSSSGRKLAAGTPSSSRAGTATCTPRGKVKPALQMISSVERKCERSLAKTPVSVKKTPPELPPTTKEQKHVVASGSVKKTPPELPRTTKEQKHVIAPGSVKKMTPELPQNSKEQRPAVAPVRPSSADPKPTPKKGHDAQKFRRHIPVDRVLEMVQTEETCAEEPQDDGVVPDTQPTDRKESRILPALQNEDVPRKTSVPVLSGQKSNLKMSTSKQGSGPKPPASVEQQPLPLPKSQSQSRSRPASAQRLSSEMSPSQLHVQLTQKLEALVREREQLHTPSSNKTPPAAAGSSRTQTPALPGPGKAKAGPVVAVNNLMPPKPTPTKALAEKATNTRNKGSAVDIIKKKEAGGTPSVKDKKLEEKENVAGDMVKFISSHYQITGHGAVKTSGPSLPNVNNKRSVFDKAWSLNSSSLLKGDSNSSGFLKSFEMTKKTSMEINEDIYAFNARSPDSSKTGVKKMNGKKASEMSPESSAISSSFARSASARKAPPAKVYGRHVKKHLFSDTDTDRDRDNGTDVSWLRDSARRPKPKVTDYGRQPTKPCPPPCHSDSSLDLPAPPSPQRSPSPKPVKEQAKPKRKRPQKKAAENKVAERKPVEKKTAAVEKKAVERKAATKPAETRGRRPRRAVTLEVSYKEDSEHSEPEEVPSKKQRTSGSSSDTTERPQPEVKNTKICPPKKSKEVSPSPPPNTKAVSPHFPQMKRVSAQQDTRKKRDISPPQKKRDISPLQKKRDISPPLRKRDSSPPQKKKRDISPLQKKRDISPPQKKRDISPLQKKRNVSPPQKKRDISPPQKRDVSRPLKKRDVSPPQKKRDVSPPQKNRDVSPPQKKRASPQKKKREASPPLKKPVKPPQESWASRIASSFFSPPAREMMRSAARSPIALSPATPLRAVVCLSPEALPPPSPDLEMPKSATAGITASSFYKPAAAAAAAGGKSRANGNGKEKLKTPSLPALPTPIGKTPSLASSRRSNTAECQLADLSPGCSPVHSLVEAHLTSTALQRSSEGSPFKPLDLDQQLRDFVKANEGAWGGVSEQGLSDNSMATLSQSSQLSAKNVAILYSQMEKTPACNRRRENIDTSLHSDENVNTSLQSGPSYERMGSQTNNISCQSDKEREEDGDADNKEEEEGEKQERRAVPRAKALKMKPRKLFKGKDKSAYLKQAAEEQSSSDEEAEEEEEGAQKVQAVQERKRRRVVRTTNKTYFTNQTHTTSTEENVAVEMSSHMVASSCSTWKTTAGAQGAGEEEEYEEEEEQSVTKEIMSTSTEMGYVCQEFSTELTRKIQKRSEKMELYNKQSLKTVQQHMASVSQQMHKLRVQRVEKVRQALLEEISSLEQDDNALKSMEKELTIHWKKQSLALHSYQERESRRLQHLKSTFQTNVSNNLEYEEQIIGTEMCLMKKNMKSVQDKFLQEMREEELSSMRRGLQTLFLSGAPLF